MFEKLRDILASQLDIDPETITPDTDIANDLGADSLDIMEFILTVEDEMGISVQQDSLKDIHTMGQVAEIVDKLVNPLK